MSYFWGRVNGPTGTFKLDPDDLSGSFVNITAKIKNMDAGNDDRNRFLLGLNDKSQQPTPVLKFTILCSLWGCIPVAVLQEID